MMFLDGQPSDIRPGTIGMTQAEIARRLVEQNPELALPANREALLKSIDEIYQKDHSITVRLTEAEIAEVIDAQTRARH